MARNELLNSLSYDPALYGLDDSFWKSVSGTPAIASSKIRINAAEIKTYMTFRYGSFRFTLDRPLDPAGGQAAEWGLENASLGETARFEVAGAVFKAVTVDADGNSTSTTITWVGAWAAADVVYEIVWRQEYVQFLVDGDIVATHSKTDNRPVFPMNIYAHNSDATNTDIASLGIIGAEYYNPSNKINVEATLEGGEINVDTNSVDVGGLIGMKTGQNGDFDVAYTAATQVTVSSLPPYVTSLYNEDIVSITQIDIGGTVLATYTRDDAQMAIAANVITVTGATFGATDTFIVYTNIPRQPVQTLIDGGTFTASTDLVTPVSGFYDSTETAVADGKTGSFGMTAKRQIKSYPANMDSGTSAGKGFEINPLSDHHEESTLAAVTNGTDATYSYYVDMDGYRNFALQTTLSGGSGTATMTVEATLQDDGTAAASCAYVDVTTALFGAASYTASGYHAVDTPVPIKYLKVKIVASTGGANDADWTLYFKKQY